jgi:hypothetical protein
MGDAGRKGIETQRKQGFPGLKKALEVQKSLGFPSLKKGADWADEGYPNLARAREVGDFSEYGRKAAAACAAKAKKDPGFYRRRALKTQATMRARRAAQKETTA